MPSVARVPELVGGVTVLSEPHPIVKIVDASNRVRDTIVGDRWVIRDIGLFGSLHAFHVHTAHLRRRLLNCRNSVPTHAHVGHAESTLRTDGDAPDPARSIELSCSESRRPHALRTPP